MPSSLSEKVAFINRKRELQEILEKETNAKENPDPKDCQKEPQDPSQPEVQVAEEKTDLAGLELKIDALQKKIDKIYDALKTLGAIKEPKAKKEKK